VVVVVVVVVLLLLLLFLALGRDTLVGVVSRRPDGRLRVVSARRVVSGNVTRAVMLSFVDNELAALYRRIRHCRRVELERRGGRAPGAAADSHRH